ncbi:MAG: hypothetical protein ABEJ56_04460 [Candidatus Nanohaloarchaea archaeon]
MSYDTLKEAPWLIDEKVERTARQKAKEKDMSPGEVFREAFLKGAEQL